MRPCLYCFDATRPKSVEHVLQKALGGSMTLTEDVCEHCNSVVFDSLDGELVRFVRLFLHNGGQEFGMMREKLLLTHEPAGVWSVLRLDRNFRPIVCPQIIFTTPTTVSVQFDEIAERDPQRSFLRMIEELSDPTALGISSWIPRLGSDVPALNPILVRTAPKVYLVIAATSAELTSISELVVSGRMSAGLSKLTPAVLARKTIDQPSVIGHVTFDFSAIERSVAKTAINFVCKVLGPEIARSSALDGLRAYALSGGESTGAVRLVLNDPLADALEFDLRRICATSEHALVLSTGTTGTICLQLLEGRLFHFVDLGNVRPLQSGRLIAARFDSKARTHEIIDFDSPQHFARLHRVAGPERHS